MRTVASSLPLALAAAWLVACGGGAAPVRTEYLLRAELAERTARVDGAARVGISRLRVAPYLDQPGIVLEGAGRDIQVARYHTWAEPLDTSLHLLLRSELARALGEEVGVDPADRSRRQHDVTVFVESLHGTSDGRAVLAADFRIETRNDPPTRSEHRFARSQPLAREGYGALVEAESALARQLAEAIAAALPTAR